MQVKTPNELRLHIHHDFGAVRAAAEKVRSFLSAHGIGQQDLWACELALVEGLNNAVKHVDGASRNKRILLEVSCAPDHVQLRITDHTSGFDMPEKVNLPENNCENGRGLFLIQSLMDHVAPRLIWGILTALCRSVAQPG
jgi:anti-sigma regulatory factor (Ser/Thr protein kinase)